jgi:hypothetical protein
MRQVKQKEKPFRSQRYMNWVKTLPCCVCGTDQGCDPHHIKGHGFGGSVKPDDRLVMPLCREHHTEFHDYPYQRFDNRWSTFNEPGQIFFVKRTLQRARNDSQLRDDLITEAENML